MNENWLLAPDNDAGPSNDGPSGTVLLATMKAQQAVAKPLLEGVSPLGRAFFLTANFVAA